MDSTHISIDAIPGYEEINTGSRIIKVKDNTHVLMNFDANTEKTVRDYIENEMPKLAKNICKFKKEVIIPWFEQTTDMIGYNGVYLHIYFAIDYLVRYEPYYSRSGFYVYEYMVTDKIQKKYAKEIEELTLEHSASYNRCVLGMFIWCLLWIIFFTLYLTCILK